MVLNSSGSYCERLLQVSPPSEPGLSEGCVGAPLVPGAKLPIPGTEAIVRRRVVPIHRMLLQTSRYHPPARQQMARKAHGTSARPVQSPLRWGCDAKLADRICSYNRHYAEGSGSFLRTSFPATARRDAASGPIVFYDSVTGRPLFRAPIGRSFAQFEAESKVGRSPGCLLFENKLLVYRNRPCRVTGGQASGTPRSSGMTFVCYRTARL